MVFRYLIAWIVLVLLGGCASADAHQLGEAKEEKASLRVVVDPAPGELYSLALSGDGRVVAGTGFGGVRAFVWTDAQGRQDLPVPEPGQFIRINGVSRDGTRVVGYGELQGEQHALLWQSGKGTIALGHLGKNAGINQTEAQAISGDGKVVSGISRTEGAKMRPFLWTEATGMRDLDPDLRDDSHPVALNRDGTVVAGRLFDPSAGKTPVSLGMHRAFRWSEAEGVQLLGEVREIKGGGNAHSVPSAISRDGRVIVGNHAADGADGLSVQHAFRWTAEEGIVDLGVLPGGVDNSSATAVNADGTIIVGSSGSNVEVFIWGAAHGMRSLEQVLQAAGVDIEGWHLRRAVGVSHDGTRILGYGRAPGRDEEIAFLATLPAEALEDKRP